LFHLFHEARHVSNRLRMDLCLGLDSLGPDDMIVRTQYGACPDAGTELSIFRLAIFAK
jgi:hypothetical protein